MFSIISAIGVPVVTCSPEVVGEDAGEDLHRVGFLALGREARLAGPALVEIALDVRLVEGDAGRAAVDDAADRRPVAFAPGRDAEKMAEGVVRHRLADRLRGRPVEIVWVVLQRMCCRAASPSFLGAAVKGGKPARRAKRVTSRGDADLLGCSLRTSMVPSDLRTDTTTAS